MIAFFANTFGYVLNFIYNLVENYGVAIILFSVLLKLILLPLSVKQQKTMIKSSKLQGKVKELQNKYKDNPEKMNQEIMALYKAENMSPFSGCISSIVQIILLIAMFSLVRNPITYMKKIDNTIVNSCIEELKQTVGEGEVNKSYPQISLIKYVKDIEEKKQETNEKEYAKVNDEKNSNSNEKVTSEQSIQVVTGEQEEKMEIEPGKSIEENKEKLFVNMEFIGLDLSNIPNQNMKDLTVFIIPILYVITSIVSTKLTTSLTKKSNEDSKNEEDVSAQMNKSMNWMIPIMSVSISLVAPLGLALYWLINNILTIIERLILNRVIKTESEE